MYSTYIYNRGFRVEGPSPHPWYMAGGGGPSTLSPPTPCGVVGGTGLAFRVVFSILFITVLINN